jgi:hypothetical protein
MHTRRLTDVAVLDLQWEGPFTLEQIGQFDHAHDHGVYQIYGTHNVLGSDTLLYIGMANQRTFAARVPEHDWIDWEPGSANIYLGRLSGTHQMTEAGWPEWEEMINRAEVLLIFFCSPPYNSFGIRELRPLPPTIIANYRRRHRLPPLVSNIYETAPFDYLKPYGETI